MRRSLSWRHFETLIPHRWHRFPATGSLWGSVGEQRGRCNGTLTTRSRLTNFFFFLRSFFFFIYSLKRGYGLTLQKRKNKKHYVQRYPRINHNLCSLSIKKHVNGIYIFSPDGVCQRSGSTRIFFPFYVHSFCTHILLLFGTSFLNKRGSSIECFLSFFSFFSSKL